MGGNGDLAQRNPPIVGRDTMMPEDPKPISPQCADDQVKQEPVLETPSGVRAYLRAGETFELLFLLNQASDAREVRLGGEWEDLWEATTVSRVTVPGVDLKLLRRERTP